MVGPLSAIVIAIAAYGGYRIYGFIHAMQAYKENTKAAWVAAPPRFFFGGIFRMLCKKCCTYYSSLLLQTHASLDRGQWLPLTAVRH